MKKKKIPDSFLSNEQAVKGYALLLERGFELSISEKHAVFS